MSDDRDSGAYSAVIWAPSSATRVAMASAEMSSAKGSGERFQAGGETMPRMYPRHATIGPNGRNDHRRRSAAWRAAGRDHDRDRRGPQEPGVLQPQPAHGHDRDDRVRHGLHARAVPPGPARAAVDGAHAAEADRQARLLAADPAAEL